MLLGPFLSDPNQDTGEHMGKTNDAGEGSAFVRRMRVEDVRANGDDRQDRGHSVEKRSLQPHVGSGGRQMLASRLKQRLVAILDQNIIPGSNMGGMRKGRVGKATALRQTAVTLRQLFAEEIQRKAHLQAKPEHLILLRRNRAQVGRAADMIRKIWIIGKNTVKEQEEQI